MMARSIIKIFSNDLFINTPSSLIIIRLNLVNNASSSLASIKFSQIEFHFKFVGIPAYTTAVS